MVELSSGVQRGSEGGEGEGYASRAGRRAAVLRSFERDCGRTGRVRLVVWLYAVVDGVVWWCEEAVEDCRG